MMRHLDGAIAERTSWLVAGIDPACAVRHHQAAASSKTQRRSRLERASRCSVAPRRPLLLASRVTPTVRASLKSP